MRKIFPRRPIAPEMPDHRAGDHTPTMAATHPLVTLR
jgi:hypothetical protein